MDISFLYLNFLLFSSLQIVINSNRFNGENQNLSQLEKEEFLKTTCNPMRLIEKAEAYQMIVDAARLINATS